MLLNKDKVAKASSMVCLEDKGKAKKKGAEDPSDRSTSVRLQLGRVGKVQVFSQAHRLVCLAYHGFPLDPSSSHACHHGCQPGGHKGCVQPFHVEWQSQEANVKQYWDVLKKA